jgi:hypothetical protein
MSIAARPASVFSGKGKTRRGLSGHPHADALLDRPLPGLLLQQVSAASSMEVARPTTRVNLHLLVGKPPLNADPVHIAIDVRSLLANALASVQVCFGCLAKLNWEV